MENLLSVKQYMGALTSFRNKVKWTIKSKDGEISLSYFPINTFIVIETSILTKM